MDKESNDTSAELVSPLVVQIPWCAPVLFSVGSRAFGKVPVKKQWRFWGKIFIEICRSRECDEGLYEKHRPTSINLPNSVL